MLQATLADWMAAFWLQMVYQRASSNIHNIVVIANPTHRGLGNL